MALLAEVAAEQLELLDLQASVLQGTQTFKMLMQVAARLTV